MLLAALAAATGLFVLLAIDPGQDTKYAPQSPVVEFPEPHLRRPEKLRSAHVRAIEAGVRLTRRERGDCEIRLEAMSALNVPCVLAIVDANTGVPLQIKSLKKGKLPTSIRLKDVRGGNHWAILTCDVHVLSHSYLHRARLQSAAPRSDRPREELPLRTATVNADTFTLNVRLSPPVQQRVSIHRTDDPAWCYRNSPSLGHHAGHVTPNDQGEVAFPRLGTGLYEIRVDGPEMAKKSVLVTKDETVVIDVKKTTK